MGDASSVDSGLWSEASGCSPDMIASRALYSTCRSCGEPVGGEAEVCELMFGICAKSTDVSA